MSAQTIATVRTLPGIRLVAVQRLSLEDRIGHLRQLARTVEWLDPAWVTILRDSFAHDSLTPHDRDAAWATLLEYGQRAADAAAGLVDWDWRCLSCGHPFARSCDDTCCPTAEVHALAVADEALLHLAGGVR